MHLLVALLLGATHLPGEARSVSASAPPAQAVPEREAFHRALRAIEEEDSSPLGRLRVLYHRAVLDSDELTRAERSLARLEPGERSSPLLLAYEGALEVLRAAHGWWPLRHLRPGIGVLDRAVETAPSDPEVRYLRLVSEVHLPVAFRRDDVVRRDLAVLRDLLRDRHSLSPSMEKLIAAFVAAEVGRL